MITKRHIQFRNPKLKQDLIMDFEGWTERTRDNKFIFHLQVDGWTGKQAWDSDTFSTEAEALAALDNQLEKTSNVVAKNPDMNKVDLSNVTFLT